MKFTFTTQLETGDRSYQDKVVVDWHYKPDLVVQDPQGRVTLWIDCGNIAVKKIDRVATWLGPAAQFYVLRRTRRESQLLTRNMRGKVKHSARVTLLWFDEDVVDRLAGLLDSTNRCACRRSEDQLQITISNRHGQHELQTAVYRSTDM